MEGLQQTAKGDYQLLERVGSGTYGKVYKAHHVPTGKIVALKNIKIVTNEATV